MKNKFLYLFVSLVLLSGCNNQPAYQNSNLSPEERAEDLLKQLTLEEKITLMMDYSSLLTDWESRRTIGGMKLCMVLPVVAWLPCFRNRLVWLPLLMKRH